MFQFTIPNIARGTKNSVVYLSVICVYVILHANQANAQSDTLCGPRCIRQLLMHYDLQTPELAAMTAEIQPELNSGTSFSQVVHYLEKSGLATQLVEVQPGAHISNEQPAIIYEKASTPDSLGHYRLLYPDDDAHTYLVWDGVNGFSRVSNANFFDDTNTLMLLTDVKDRSRFRHRARPPGFFYGRVIALLGIVAIGATCLSHVNFARKGS